MGVAVGAGNDEAHVVEEEGLRFGAVRELRHMVHESGITGFFGTGCLAEPGVFEVETVSSGPLPRVIEIEHGFHVAFTHLSKQEVQSVEDGIIIDTGRELERGFHFGQHPSFAVRAN